MLGFLGSHCILQAIQADYTVHTTIRSLKRASEVKQSLLNGGATESQIKNVKYFEADLTKDSGWDSACQGCKYVLHVASPIPSMNAKSKEDLVGPAKEGTLRVLRAAKRAGTVTRVVLTSSTEAVCAGQDVPPGKVFDEKDWTNLGDPNFPITEYQRSKTIAEWAAWDFIEKEGNGKMDLAVINPVGIFGPALSSDVATSLQLPLMLLNGKLPGIPNVTLNAVDVRDVASLHLLAMTNPKASGQRFIATSDDLTVSIREVADILKEGLPKDETKKVATRAIPDFLIKFAALFDSTAALTAPNLSKPRPVSNARAKSVLGWKPRTTKDAILASAESLKRYGLIKK